MDGRRKRVGDKDKEKEWIRGEGEEEEKVWCRRGAEGENRVLENKRRNRSRKERGD